MAAGDFRICPNCDTRNKATWEYCARCGEDLQGVPRGLPAAATPQPEPPAGADASGSWLGLVGLVAVVGLIAYASTRLYPPATPERPSSQLFTIPTVPASTVPAPSQPATSAEQAFEEGRRLLVQGDAAGAARALARAVAEAPENADYRNMYAKALLASGAPETETIRQFEEAMRLGPGRADYAADLARAYDKLGRNDEAAEAYARALDLSPDDTRTLREASSLHARRGHPEAGLPYLRRLGALRPDDLVVQQELGLAYEKAGERDSAAQTYREILERFPQAALTRGLLSEMLLKDGKSDEALALLRAGIERDPDGALLHRTLASALERTGHVAEAVREYREYARLNPGSADARAMADRAARLEARVARSQSS